MFAAAAAAVASAVGGVLCARMHVHALVKQQKQPTQLTRSYWPQRRKKNPGIGQKNEVRTIMDELSLLNSVPVQRKT